MPQVCVPVLRFSPVCIISSVLHTQFSPVSIIPPMLHTQFSPVSIIPLMLHTQFSPVSVIPPMLHTQFSSASIIPPMLHTHFNTALIRKTSELVFGNLKIKQCSFVYQVIIGLKSICTFFVQFNSSFFVMTLK
jgi:hypothetical protein